MDTAGGGEEEKAEVNWVETARGDFESEKQWLFRRQFLLRNTVGTIAPQSLCLDQLLAYSMVWANHVFMGCRYPTKVMEKVLGMAKGIQVVDAPVHTLRDDLVSKVKKRGISNCNEMQEEPCRKRLSKVCGSVETVPGAVNNESSSVSGHTQDVMQQGSGAKSSKSNLNPRMQSLISGIREAPLSTCQGSHSNDKSYTISQTCESTAVLNLVESMTAALPLPQSSAATLPLPETSAAALPLPQSSALVLPLPESSAAAFPLPVSSAAALPLPESSAAALLHVEPSAAALPLVEPSAAALPLVESSAAALPFLEPSPMALPFLEPSPATLPLLEPALPILGSSSPALPLLGSSSPALPILGSSSPALPILGSLSPVLPLLGSSSTSLPQKDSKAMSLHQCDSSVAALPQSESKAQALSRNEPTPVALPPGQTISVAFPRNESFTSTLPLLESTVSSSNRIASAVSSSNRVESTSGVRPAQYTGSRSLVSHAMKHSANNSQENVAKETSQTAISLQLPRKLTADDTKQKQTFFNKLYKSVAWKLVAVGGFSPTVNHVEILRAAIESLKSTLDIDFIPLKELTDLPQNKSSQENIVCELRCKSVYLGTGCGKNKENAKAIAGREALKVFLKKKVVVTICKRRFCGHEIEDLVLLDEVSRHVNLPPALRIPQDLL